MKHIRGKLILGAAFALLLASSPLGCNRDPGKSASDGKPAGDNRPVSDAGSLDAVDCKAAQGWAWDKDHPDDVVTVDILDGTTLLGTVTADLPRQDLANAKKGNGKHAFTYAMPAAVRDGKPHTIHAVLSATKAELNLSPKSISCPG